MKHAIMPCAMYVVLFTVVTAYSDVENQADAGVPAGSSHVPISRVRPCGRFFVRPNGATDALRAFRRDGTPAGVFQQGQVNSASGTLGVDANGNLLIGQWDQDNVLAVSPAGELVRTIDTGGLNGIQGTALTPSGDIAICSYLTDSIKFYQTDGTYLDNLGHSGTEDPVSLAYGWSGMLYVGSRNNANQRIAVFDDQLVFIKYIGEGELGSNPHDIAFDMSGFLHVATDAGVRKFDPTNGALLETWTHPDLVPRGMAFDENENLYVTDADSFDVFVFDSTGQYVDRITLDPGSNPPAGLTFWGIAFSVLPDGDCNSNGTGDACDIGAGASDDCNFNGVPDECELTGNDCNSNGIPDGCEPDCNTNGLADACDIAGGTSADCNSNGVPDECDIAFLNAALEFDGGDDQVRVPRDSRLEPVEEITVEAWVRPDSVGPFHSRILRIAGHFGSGYILAWQQQGDQRLQLRIDGAEFGSVSARDTLTTGSYVGQWLHVAGVYSAPGNYCRLYVNGTLRRDEPGVGLMNYAGSDLYIGNFINSNEDFDGIIDEVRIWDVARTQAEIQAAMGQGLLGTEPGLVGYWRFDDWQGQTAVDSSPYGHDGVLGTDGDPGGDPQDPIWARSGAPSDLGDCNTNGIPDDCDIAAGTSEDCNFNGRPDECEPDEDCNTNGVQDICDIAVGTSNDCNNTNVPDECELTDSDCNTNGVPDSCEDCNTNGLADECDIAGGSSDDCNTNGIPDECEPDCNSNGIADQCDITTGTSFDFDDNAVPDECQPDCNTNGFPDFLDIAFGMSDDCNTNTVPDECDLSSGSGQDCNTNGWLDECDIAGGFSEDCQLNDTPDECEPDADGDTIPDECDQKGDFDHDADVDLADYEVFEICLFLSGPNEPGPFSECSDAFDFNADADVDLEDFGAFQAVFDG